MRLLLAMVLLGTSSLAQGTIVYPLANQGREGALVFNTPFDAPTLRYHQLLREAKGRQHAVKSLALRRDGLRPAPNAVARTVSLAISAGAGSWTAFSATFAANWIGNPVAAFTRKNVNLPSWTQTPPAAPAPFTARFPFDAQYAHSGQNELLLELVVYSNTQMDEYPTDVDGFGAYTAGTQRWVGAGCQTNTSGTGVYSQTAVFQSSGQDSYVSLVTWNAPANAAVALMIGVQNPNLAVPGLCTRVYSDNRVLVQMGVANGSGALGAFDLSVGAWNAGWAGVTLHTQAVSLDNTKPGIKLALSQGTQMTLPVNVPWTPTTLQFTMTNDLTSAKGALLMGGGAVVELGT